MQSSLNETKDLGKEAHGDRCCLYCDKIDIVRRERHLIASWRSIIGEGEAGERLFVPHDCARLEHTRRVFWRTSHRWRDLPCEREDGLTDVMVD